MGRGFSKAREPRVLGFLLFSFFLYFYVTELCVIEQVPWEVAILVSTEQLGANQALCGYTEQNQIKSQKRYLGLS